MNLEENLRQSKPATEPPPFLHSRIMHAVKSGAAPELPRRFGVRQLTAAFATLALLTTLLLLSRNPTPKQTAGVAVPIIEVPALPKVALPPNASLELEIKNLKLDTQNAARALAANFLPSGY